MYINITEYIDLYSDLGDHIALQYGGSAAHKKVKGNITTSSLKGSELLTSIKRYYSNSFTDALKQDAINVYLGIYIPIYNSIPLWEYESDYFLHNNGFRPPISNVIQLLYDLQLYYNQQKSLKIKGHNYDLSEDMPEKEVKGDYLSNRLNTIISEYIESVHTTNSTTTNTTTNSIIKGKNKLPEENMLLDYILSPEYTCTAINNTTNTNIPSSTNIVSYDSIHQAINRSEARKKYIQLITRLIHTVEGSEWEHHNNTTNNDKGHNSDLPNVDTLDAKKVKEDILPSQLEPICEPVAESYYDITYQPNILTSFDECICTDYLTHTTEFKPVTCKWLEEDDYTGSSDLEGEGGVWREALTSAAVTHVRPYNIRKHAHTNPHKNSDNSSSYTDNSCIPVHAPITCEYSSFARQIGHIHTNTIIEEDALNPNIPTFDLGTYGTYDTTTTTTNATTTTAAHTTAHSIIDSESYDIYKSYVDTAHDPSLIYTTNNTNTTYTTTPSNTYTTANTSNSNTNATHTHNINNINANSDNNIYDSNQQSFIDALYIQNIDCNDVKAMELLSYNYCIHTTYTPPQPHTNTNATTYTNSIPVSPKPEILSKIDFRAESSSEPYINRKCHNYEGSNARSSSNSSNDIYIGSHRDDVVIDRVAFVTNTMLNLEG